MMNKHCFVLALTTLSVVAGCTRDTLPAVEDGGQRIVCRIEDSSPVTKTALKDDPGVRMMSRWQGGDAIGIFSANASNQRYEVLPSTISSDGKEAGFQGADASVKGDLMAYSPYQEGAQRSGDGLVVSFPATQQYAAFGPDPAANIMAGSGDSKQGLTFRPVGSILKIGQVFDEETVLTSIEFRDLSGKAVCGSMKITAGNPAGAEITGSGTVLTLDFGGGLQIGTGEKRPFYLIVPARAYSKGFSLTFVTDGGKRTVKTIGSTSGRTLGSGKVYPIGDMTRYDYLDNTARMMDGAFLVTAEKAELMTVIRKTTTELRGADGNAIRYPDGMGYYHGPALELLVRDEFALQEGNFLVFEYGSELVPEGGVLKVMSSQDLGGGYHRVYAASEANVAAPYAQLQVGGKMYDDAGNLNEEEGTQLDLSAYITEIRDDGGNPVPFGISPDGELFFGPEAASRLTGVQTKGSASPSFSFPGLSLNIKKPHAEAVFGASLKLNTRIAAGAVQGEFQYLYITVNPVFSFSADFKLTASFSETSRKHLVTLYCAPIPLAPGVMVTPEMDIWAYVGIGGDLVFSASMKYDYDMGTFGIAYNKGDGFTSRHIPPKPSETDAIKLETGGLSGSLYAHGGFELSPKFSIYGMMEAGVQANCGLKFGITDSSLSGWSSPKLFLQPMIELFPVIATLGGYFTKSFKNLTVTIDIAPIWERYLWPKIDLWYGFYGPTKAMKEFGYRSRGDYHDEHNVEIVEIMTPVFKEYGGWWFGVIDDIYTHVDGLRARVRSSLPTLSGWNVYVEFLEGGTLGITDHQYAYLAPVFTTIGQASRVTVPASGMSAARRVLLASIPSGEKESDVTLDITPQIPDGKVFSYRFVMVDNFSGKEYTMDREPLRNGLVDVQSAYMVSWPHAPDGSDYFIKTKIVRASDFDGSVPLKARDSMYEPDGYANPPEL